MTGIERLRKLTDATLGYVRVASVTPHDYEYENDVEWDERTRLSELLASIYSQINREQDAMVADSRYEALPPEEREAIAWVREHGGLDAVDAIWDNDVQLAEAVISELWPDGRPDECGNDDVMGELRRRLMPEGYEWPRYDASEPMRIGGAIADELGHGHVVTSVELHDDGADLHWNPAEPEDCVWVGHGEPVRRPAKPEPSDSWERLEEDASKEACEYFGSKRCDCSTCKRLERSVKDCGTSKARDLVRRCRALAERERGE